MIAECLLVICERDRRLKDIVLRGAGQKRPCWVDLFAFGWSRMFATSVMSLKDVLRIWQTNAVDIPFPECSDMLRDLERAVLAHTTSGKAEIC